MHVSRCADQLQGAHCTIDVQVTFMLTTSAQTSELYANGTAVWGWNRIFVTRVANFRLGHCWSLIPLIFVYNVWLQMRLGTISMIMRQ